MNFEGKVALITGGTAGIGEATVRRVARLGARVVFADRNQGEGEHLLRELNKDGAEAAFLKADLSHPDEIRRIVPATVDIFGRLDYAFNNAGTSGQNGLIADQAEANFDEVFSVNVRGLFITLQEEIRQMLEQDGAARLSTWDR
jgi:NAD(P)-dependent dehydrogenase (short-subunit alcohol dehydrogenase family)